MSALDARCEYVCDDMRNGIRLTMNAEPLSSFLSLSQAEQTHLDNLVMATTSLNNFFTDRRDNPEDWIQCSRCMEDCRLPVSEKNWKEIPMTCGKDLNAAQNTILLNPLCNKTFHSLLVTKFETMM